MKKYYKCFYNSGSCLFNFKGIYLDLDRLIEDASKTLIEQGVIGSCMNVYDCQNNGCVLGYIANIMLTSNGVETKFVKIYDDVIF